MDDSKFKILTRRVDIPSGASVPILSKPSKERNEAPQRQEGGGF